MGTMEAGNAAFSSSSSNETSNLSMHNLLRQRLGLPALRALLPTGIKRHTVRMNVKRAQRTRSPSLFDLRPMHLNVQRLLHTFKLKQVVRIPPIFGSARLQRSSSTLLSNSLLEGLSTTIPTGKVEADYSEVNPDNKTMIHSAEMVGVGVLARLVSTAAGTLRFQDKHLGLQTTLEQGVVTILVTPTARI